MSENTASARTPNLLTVAIILVALAAVFLIGLRLHPNPDPATRGVVTSGKGSVTTKPDLLRFTVTVTNTAPTTATAMTRTNSNVKTVLAALKNAGIADKDVTTTSIQVDPSYDNNGQKITGYSSSQSLRVTVRDLATAGGVISKTTTAAGNSVSVGDVVMAVSNKSTLIVQARTKAVQAAKKAAEALAEAGGRKIGDLVYVADESTDAPPVYPTAGYASAAGSASPAASPVPISSGQQKVSVTVHARWSLK
jgi:uncharacterized protein YggE